MTTVYYAPYLGQMNVGERLTAAQAMKGLRSALDGIRRHTRNRLFIDQLNVVYNSPGFKAHARLLDAEMDRFLNQAAVYIANETLGYALWAYKDYYQNLLYNPSFQLGLHGWETDGQVQRGPHGLELRAGAAVRQVVGAERMAQALGPDAPLRTLRLGVECDRRRHRHVGRRRSIRDFRPQRRRGADDSRALR